MNEISDIVRDGVSKSISDIGKHLGDSLLSLFRNHVSNRYPGSSHWNPQKINIGETTEDSATIDINIPGAGRAYHDIDILPIRSRLLTIPIHQSAYGKQSARDFKDLFVVKKRNGNAFLCQKNGSSLAFMYVLKDHIHQKTDPSLLPQDDAIVQNLFESIEDRLSQIKFA